MSRILSILIGLVIVCLTSTVNAENTAKVYLADFLTEEQMVQTKISFHHALLADHQEKLLLELNDNEVELLTSKGISLSAADAIWHEKLKAMSVNRSNKHSHLPNAADGIFGFSCYETVEETFAEVNRLQQAYPQLTELVDIGDSWQKQQKNLGYDLLVLKIGNKALIDPPILFIQSAMHAREYATAALTLDFAKLLLDNPNNNPDIDWILQRHQIHILFHTNPDGRKIAETGIYQRKNVNENHCPSNTIGVDLNRNFSYGWNSVVNGSSGEACSEVYRGDAPASEPEVAALENYIRTIFPDVRGEASTDAAPKDTQGLYLDIHSYGRLILWPYGHSNELAPNSKGLEALGKKIAFFNGYLPQQSVGLYPTDGTSDNLAYGELGIAHLTFELGTEFFQQCDIYNERIKPDNLKALLYAAKVAQAPYLLTLGPDIESLEIGQTGNATRAITGTATDVNYRDPQASQSTHNISQVKYSFNQYPNDDNSNLAVLSNDSVAAKSKEFSIEITDNTVETVYIQAYNETGQAGPVSAIRLTADIPDAQASVSCTGARCTFVSSNLSEQFSYQWQLQDGKIKQGSEVEFILPNTGEFTVTHSVENTVYPDLSAHNSISFTVDELLAPEVSLVVNCTLTNCNFDASQTNDQDSENLSYSWDFGDNNTSDLITTTHSYGDAGSYTVSLTVTDEHQQQTTKSQTIQVSEATEEQPETEEKSSSGGLVYYLLVLLLLGLVKRNCLKINN